MTRYGKVTDREGDGAICCAHCGRPYPGEPRRFDAEAAALRFRLTPKETRLLVAVAKRPDRLVSYDALHEAIYGDDPQGGPEKFSQCLRHFAKKVNARLSAEGYRLRTIWGQGYTFERLDEQAADTPALLTKSRPGEIRHPTRSNP